MTWIEYDYVCNADKGVIFRKKVEYNEANLEIAKKEAIDGVYVLVEDANRPVVRPVPISLGGTNATTAEQARENIGAAPALLVEGINYGKELPSAGTKGRLFFRVIEDEDEGGDAAGGI